MKKSKLNFYLNNDWQGGVMYTNDSLVVNGLLYRYNIYTDQIEMRSVVSNTSIDVVSIGSQKFIYSDFYTEDSTLADGYLELISNGECRLLVRRDVDYKKGKDEVDAYGTNASTMIKKRYYIKRGDNAAILIEKNKEFISEILSDKNEFVSYINKKILLIINERKLIELVNYYNNI